MKFRKGHSGNPGGRPKEDPELRQMARGHTKEAIETAVKWMRSDNPKASLQAVQILLDRGHGKPLQAHEISGRDGGPMELEEQRNINIKAWMDQTAREIGLVQWERGAGRDGPLETGSFSPEERTRDRRTRTASIAAS